MASFDWSLFFSALISSTLFPGGSEALLLLKLDESAGQATTLILIATAGNVLGSIITYTMGYLGFEVSHRWFRISEEKRAKAEHQFNRYGNAALLFAWLPIIGDPLCLAAGILRFNFGLFIVLVSTGKFLRYTVIATPFL